MSSEKVTATLGKWVQVGPDDFEKKLYSKIFNVEAPFSELFNWAEEIGIKNAVISDFTFSEYSGEI